MLEPGVFESSPTYNTGFFMTDPKPPDYTQGVRKKNTVKELLMMRRQNWTCSLDDDCGPERKVKIPKLEVLSSCAAAVNSNMTNGSMVENGLVEACLQQEPTSPLSPAPGAKLTLFHWQIQQEARKIGAASPEMLTMQDADGDTCLHIAVAQGRRALAFVLAAKMSMTGCLDMKEHNGQTALQIAAATDQHLIVQDLLAHGAQINIRDLWGRSPLHVCAEKGHVLSLQRIWKFIEGSGQTIDIEMYNYDGFTPLHAAVLSHNTVVKELRTLKNPCCYMTTELKQKKRMFVNCIKILLHMGASLGAKDLKSGRTCLHMASEEANVELFDIFLDQQSSLSVVNVQMFNGNTALHVLSSLQGHQAQVEAVKRLVRKGADPGSRNFEGELPAQLVPDGPISDTVRHILKGRSLHA